MGLNKNIGSYEDCKEIFDKAYEMNGARMTLSTPSAAIRLRHRLNYYRSLLRKQNRQAYPEGHPMHGATPFDHFVIRVREAEVRIEPTSADGIEILPLQPLEN